MCQRLALFQISDCPEIRSLRLVLAEKQTLYQTVLSETPEMRSLKPRLDRGEALFLLPCHPFTHQNAAHGIVAVLARV